MTAGDTTAADAQRVRDLLDTLVDALRHHLAAVEHRTGEADPAVFRAYDHLREAFEAYEESLYDSHDEVTPFGVVEPVEEDDEDLLDG